MLFNNEFTNDYTIFYRFLHIIQGALLAITQIPKLYRLLLFLSILLYQGGQLILNIRYFFHMNKVLQGNSINHTMSKLLDYFIGYALYNVIYSLYVKQV